MKILWVSNIFLHPTTKGGQIRTLEMLKRMHRRHEIHFIANGDPKVPEGPARAGEYSSSAYSCRYRASRRFSPEFFRDVAGNLFSSQPLIVNRRRSPDLQAGVERLRREVNFDSLVCDFLTPTINLANLEGWVLFQHNVETMIFRRYADNAKDPVRRWYLRNQAGRLFRYERNVCAKVRHVVAVSDSDAEIMRREFAIGHVTPIPTGVDIDYFAPQEQPPGADMVFVGSMDWLPNVDGMEYFVRDMLPLIRKRFPRCSVAIVGRDPGRSIRELAARDPFIQVTGTVPDVRPYLWGSKLAIVPLRIGGGTRLKIYEAMAARAPVVSTSIGAEGLAGEAGREIHLADTPDTFAARCTELLESENARRAMSEAAWQMVAGQYSWESVALRFEAILEAHKGVPRR